MRSSSRSITASDDASISGLTADVSLESLSEEPLLLHKTNTVELVIIRSVTIHVFELNRSVRGFRFGTHTNRMIRWTNPITAYYPSRIIHVCI